MAYSQQVLHTVEISRLKGIIELAPLALDTNPLTAITGTNGCGKSTILHALACVYAPTPFHTSHNFKFPQFFLPTTDASWQGSSFAISHSYRFSNSFVERAEMAYGKANDRWTPRYERRPQRYVDYIGIDTCVPSIERERSTSFLELTSLQIDESNAIRAIRNAASAVLNRSYDSLSTRSSRKRRYRGVEHRGLGYSSLSMGAGEQRVFEIVERVFSAPKNALIIIDEIDLLLHEDALRRLITVLSARAQERNLQVVFTTHRESLLGRDDITVHHIFDASGKTLAMPAAHPDVWHRLTGDSVRSLEVFVEDDLAQSVVNKIAVDAGVRKHVETVIVGAAANLFTLVGGLALRGECLEKKLAVLDGDVYRTAQLRIDQTQRVVTGHGSRIELIRDSVLSAISMLALPDDTSPEVHIHSMLISMPWETGGEVASIARSIGVPMDRHGYIDAIIDRLGEIRAVGLSRIVETAAKSDLWTQYVAPVHDWLIASCERQALLPASQTLNVRVSAAAVEETRA